MWLVFISFGPWMVPEFSETSRDPIQTLIFDRQSGINGLKDAVMSIYQLLLPSHIGLLGAAGGNPHLGCAASLCHFLSPGIGRLSGGVAAAFVFRSSTSSLNVTARFSWGFGGSREA